MLPNIWVKIYSQRLHSSPLNDMSLQVWNTRAHLYRFFFQQYNLSIMQSVVAWMHRWEIAYSEEPCRWRDNYQLHAEFQHQRGSWQHLSRLFRGQLYKVVTRNFKVLALFISFSAFNSQVPTNKSFPSHKTATWIYPLICNDRENYALYTELSWGGRGAVTEEWWG